MAGVGQQTTICGRLDAGQATQRHVAAGSPAGSARPRPLVDTRLPSHLAVYLVDRAGRSGVVCWFPASTNVIFDDLPL